MNAALREIPYDGPLTVEPEAGKWANAKKFVPPAGVTVRVSYLDARGLHLDTKRCAAWDEKDQCWKWAGTAGPDLARVESHTEILAWTKLPISRQSSRSSGVRTTPSAAISDAREGGGSP